MNTIECKTKEEYETHLKTMLVATANKTAEEADGMRGYLVFVATESGTLMSEVGNARELVKLRRSVLKELGVSGLAKAALVFSVGLLAGFMLSGLV